MSRTRARIIAVTVVLGAIAFASLAHGQFAITSNPTNHDNVPIGQPVRAVVSIRNAGSAATTITGISKHNPMTSSCLSQIMASTLSGTLIPVTLQPNQQLQVLVQAPSFSAGDLVLGPPGCLFDVDAMTGSGSAATFFVDFDNAGGSAWELQPHVMSFGTQTGFEIQSALALNHSTGSASYMTAQINDPTGTFTFQSPCMGLQQCAGISLPSGGFQTLQIRCAPQSGNTVTATLGLYGASVQLAGMQLTCTGTAGAGSATIDIIPPMLDIVGPQGVPAMSPIAIGFQGSAGAWRMTNLDINGDTGNAFAFAPGTAGCAGDNCTFVAPDRALPTDIDITCTPDGGTRLATLVAQGQGGANDFDMATLRCLTGSGGGPTMIVSPVPVVMPTTAVNTPAPTVPLTITNGGGGTLELQLALGLSDWTASSCVSSMCQLTGMGSSTTIDIGFTPSGWGDRSSNLSITNNGPTSPFNVGLLGTGSGATLEVTDPAGPAYEIDFGTIPRGSAPQRPLTFLATGNVGVTVDVGPPGMPFTASPSQVPLTPGIPSSAMIGCTSATAGGPFTETITFTSNAYSATPTSITARCTIADTDLEITPTTFDFGEVRIGGATAEIPITLRNPSPFASLVVHSMRLSSSSAGLSLDAPITSDVTLGPGETLTARMVLEPTTEVDLAGRSLQISIDASDLTFPITGKVVRASAYVVPSEELDLGTVCVGSTVTGQVIMVNDGTATLTMQRPQMTNELAAIYQDPTDYPAPLLASRTAMIGVTPSASASGLLEGSVTWDVDAPGAPFVLPVRLEYILDGTAISPKRVPFGVIAVETRSERKMVRLENCGDVPVTLDLGGVSARTGGTAAWDVQPDRGSIVLPPSGVQILSVVFAPKRRGSYAATIEIELDGIDADVEIFGDASGPVLEPKSFYACSCAGATAPSSGWPIVLAFAFVVAPRFRRRYRSGSSSAR